MTSRSTSPRGSASHRPADSANSRTPALRPRLGLRRRAGRVEHELYERPARATRAIKFRIGSNGQFEDLPRDATGRAIISDPRNDENMMISGLHAAVPPVSQPCGGRRLTPMTGVSCDEVFRRARRLTTWHYQWMVVHEFLPLFIGEATVDDIVRHGRKFYRPEVVQIPVEFQGAAYRFGHSMVRPSYRANLAGDNTASLSSAWSSIRTPRASPIPATSEVAPASRGASLAGRPSSISEPIPRPSGSRHAGRGRAPEQAHRLPGSPPPSSTCRSDDCLGRRRPPSLPPAQPTSPGHVGHPLRPEHRADHATCRPSPSTILKDLKELSASAWTSPRRCGSTVSRRPK